MNQNPKESFGKRAGDFFAGRGFYIALTLCVAVIGASAWAMLSSQNQAEEYEPQLPVMGELDDWGAPALGTWNEGQTEDAPDEDAADEDAWLFGDDDEKEDEDDGTETEEPPAAAPPAPAALWFVWPTGGEVVVPHAVEHLIFNRTMGDWRAHFGIDIAGDLGETVLAVASGTVERIFHDELMGTTVIIDHGSGVQSLYANLAEVPTVTEGQWVEVGSVIGAIGNTTLVETGIVTHLHLEIFEDGVSVDPLNFLPPR